MQQVISEKKEQSKIIPLSKWNDFYDFPKVSTLRQLVFKNTDNFEKEVIRRIATRVYIDVEAFFNWVDKQKAAS